MAASGYLQHLSAALQLSGRTVRSPWSCHRHEKFAAFAIVCMFWFLSGTLPTMLAATLRVDWLKKLAATASARAFRFRMAA